MRRKADYLLWVLITLLLLEHYGCDAKGFVFSVLG